MNGIEKLQETVAYQERTIEELNNALASQQQQMSRIQDELKILSRLMREWREENRDSGEAGQGAMHELPPHY